MKMQLSATASIIASATCTAVTPAYFQEKVPQLEISASPYTMGLFSAGALDIVRLNYEENLTSAISPHLTISARFSAARSLADIAQAELAAMESLQDDWRGAGSRPPSEEHIRTARRFVASFWRDGIARHAPEVGADFDGEIVFSWNNSDVVGSLSIVAVDEFSFYIKNKKSGDVARGQKSGVRELPEDLLKVTRIA